MLSTRGTVWEAVTQFWADEVWGAQYITHRKVGIADRRLAYIHRALQVVVLFYVICVQIALWHRYAAFETPAAYINVWPGTYTSSVTPTLYCNNPAYDWGQTFSAEDMIVTGGYTFGPNSSCLDFSAQRDLAITSTSAAVTTYAGYTPIDPSQGGTQTFYIAHPEGASFNVIHVMSASFISGGLANVRTIIRASDGSELRSFPNGIFLQNVAIADWLSFAGVSLESKQELSPLFDGGSSAKWPLLRQTGVVSASLPGGSSRS